MPGGVTIEAGFARLMAGAAIRHLLGLEPGPNDPRLGYRDIASFY